MRAGTVARCSLAATTAAGDGRDDGELVGGGDGGGFFGGEIADVVVVEVEVDEGAEVAFGGEEVLLHGGVCGDEGGEAFGDGGGGDGDGLLLVGEGSERGGDVNLHGSLEGEMRRLVSVRWVQSIG